MAFDDAVQRGSVKAGDLVAFVGSGVGYNQAGAVFRVGELPRDGELTGVCYDDRDDERSHRYSACRGTDHECGYGPRYDRRDRAGERLGRLRAMIAGDVLGERARLTPDAPALVVVDPPLRLSYGELDERATRCAAAWCALGLRKGDRVALLAHNRVEYLDAFFAAGKSGVVLVTLGTRATPHELAPVLADCAPRVVLYDGAFASTVAALREGADPAQSSRALDRARRAARPGRRALRRPRRRRRSRRRSCASAASPRTSGACSTPRAPPAVPRA